ncbi:MAG: MXAN_2562 family outer membrane beta-barrel protein, partial [Deltaproteobacteria bacterium]|nr:MXAN_2562 family outer membrane beta-barrel protein [Deltaproteobacteria bacterium]
MKSRWLLALFGLSAIALHPFAATAQISYTFRSYGPRGAPPPGATNYFINWPLSRSECAANEPILIDVVNAPFDASGGMRLEWDLWQGGTGTAGANCQMAINRRMNMGSSALCVRREWSGGGQITNTMVTLSFRPSELFPSGCADTPSGTYVFYVLAVSAPGDTTTDLPANRFFAFSIGYDRDPPSPPQARNASGDRQVVIEWSNTTTETLAGARVYVDLGASCGGSTSLMPGAPPPPTIRPSAEVSGSAPTRATIDAMALGLEFGQSAPFAVTVFDLARNESVLSNIACLERVPVQGFWDSYCRERMLDPETCKERYGGCSIRGNWLSQSEWKLVLLMVVFVLLRRKRHFSLLFGPFGALVTSAHAHAQSATNIEPIANWSDVPVFQPSSEGFTIELRMGAYRPELGESFRSSFGGDLGPMLALELDAHLFRIPYVGPFQGGGRVSWAEWTGPARSSASSNVSGNTGMSLLLFTALLSLRVDGMARHLGFPLVLTPKLGLDCGYFQTGTSGALQADGWSFGIAWGAQIAVELDFLERRAARRLDEEWGLNHSEVFFELYGSCLLYTS